MQKGTPEEAVNLMIASLSDNTIKQYNASFKLWWLFCQNRNLDPFLNSTHSVIIFLTKQFDNGASYSTLNTHRSALSLLLGNKIGADEEIKRLLKGAFKLRTPKPKYNCTWDPQRVLNLASEWYPNQDLSLKNLTKKLVILLALCTAHRVQTLSLIKIANLKISDQGIHIVIPDIIKTSAPGRDQPLLFLPFLNEQQNICPAKTLQDYLEVTNKIRPNNVDHLILTHKKPHKAATSQSISRWIKEVLSESGIDTSVFSAHSTRHASTSAAASAGVSIDAIRRAAGWTDRSSVFVRYYNRPILDNTQFSRYMAN